MAVKLATQHGRLRRACSELHLARGAQRKEHESCHVYRKEVQTTVRANHQENPGPREGDPTPTHPQTRPGGTPQNPKRHGERNGTPNANDARCATRRNGETTTAQRATNAETPRGQRNGDAHQRERSRARTRNADAQRRKAQTNGPRAAPRNTGRPPPKLARRN